MTQDSAWDEQAFNFHSDFQGDFIDGSYGPAYNLLTDENFFSQVWHKTMAMSIPCMMQIDNTNFNPDQFVLVRARKNSLKIKRTAKNMYTITLDLEECF